MRLGVDASTLVGELLRERGLKLLVDPRLVLYVPAKMWEATEHEVSKRLDTRVSRGLPEPIAARLLNRAVRVKERSVTEVPEEIYEDLKDEALSRLPRDPRDCRWLPWPFRSMRTSSPRTKTFSVAVSRSGRWIP